MGNKMSCAMTTATLVPHVPARLGSEVEELGGTVK
jgi:hypothetical protein